MPKVALRGYPRLIFCANNQHILDTQESMTSEDRQAFAERLVHIELRDRHATFFKKNLKRIKEDWLGKRHLAQHLLWLGQNHVIKNPGQRFIVKGSHTNLHDSLAGGSGLAAEVVQWLLSYVSAPKQIDSKGDAPIELSKEKHHLRVTALGVVNNWDRYLKTQPPQRTSEVQRALRSISHTGFQRISTKNAGRTSYWKGYEIDLRLLKANLDRHHLTEEDFDLALGSTDSAN